MQNPFTQLMTFLKSTNLLSPAEKADYADKALSQGYLTEKQKASLEKKMRARMAKKTH